MPTATPESEAKSKTIHTVATTAGVPEVDAGLIADCVMHDKCMSWMNTDEPKAGSVEAVNAALVRDNINLKVNCEFYSRGSKYLWETKRLRPI